MFTRRSPKGTTIGFCKCCLCDDRDIVDLDTCMHCFVHIASDRIRRFLSSQQNLTPQQVHLYITILFNFFRDLDLKNTFNSFAETPCWKSLHNADFEITPSDLSSNTPQWKLLHNILTIDVTEYVHWKHFRRMSALNLLRIYP